MTFKRPSNGLQTPLQTGVQTPFKRPSDGLQTGFTPTPHTPPSV